MTKRERETEPTASIFPDFCVNVPMPSGTAVPRSNSAELRMITLNGTTYHAEAGLRPWLQYEGLSAPPELVTEIPTKS